ncbi:DUF882 domain-containing protein [Salipiger sp. PrR003]|uniref:DUF882 domain-containing protein n=1 Tax=Salipiger sp. PrR003 TaxID=2706776 RepID=UPI0019428C95|nr:DUF882 domain-containing protein [Salipiger sp. PrR003]
MNRRSFLASLAGGALSAALPQAATAFGVNSVRVLELRNTHPIDGRIEHARVPYWRNGRYDARGLGLLNHMMRDWRNERVHKIDPELFDIFYALQTELRAREGLHLISGYRSPETNAMLRSRSSGVAKHSLHMEGMAGDIRIPGVELHTLRKTAMNLQLGGVGYYPRSNFVHVDTGRVRTW